HQQRRRSSLARHVAERDHQTSIFALDEVVVIATDLVTRKTDTLQLVAIHVWRRGRLEALLDLARKRKLTLESLAFESCFNETRILNADRGNRRQRSQNLQVIFSESTFRDR